MAYPCIPESHRRARYQRDPENEVKAATQDQLVGSVEAVRRRTLAIARIGAELINASDDYQIEHATTGVEAEIDNPALLPDKDRAKIQIGWSANPENQSHYRLTYNVDPPEDTAIVDIGWETLPLSASYSPFDDDSEPALRIFEPSRGWPNDYALLEKQAQAISRDLGAFLVKLGQD